MPSTFSLLSCWGILIYFFMLYQIGMYQPEYAHPGRYNLETKQILEFSWIINSLVVVLLATCFEVYHISAFI